MVITRPAGQGGETYGTRKAKATVKIITQDKGWP